MLVQRTETGLRCIPQHDHALASGEMAGAWRGFGAEPARLSGELVMATALHDMGWRRLNRAPRWNAETGRPYDFVDYPTDDKIAMYGEGIAEASDILPYAGLLISLHYTTFSGTRGLSEFQRDEEARRARLRRELPGRDHDAAFERDLAWLKLFDNLSLFLCLLPPSAGAELRPRWLTPDLAVTPDGEKMRWHFVGDDRLVVDPFPFDDELALSLPVIDLPASRFASQEALDRAWAATPASRWEPRLSGPAA